MTDPVADHDVQRVTRAVMLNQILWTAGYSLISGGFLNYFGYELGAKGVWVALMLAVPETAAVFGLTSRWVVARMGNRKRVWISMTLVGRLCSLGIPLMVFASLRPSAVSPFVIFLVALTATHIAQSIAYIAYLSWLSDLVPEVHWGRFFARRNIAQLMVMICVPMTGAFLREHWRDTFPPSTALVFYVMTFSVGTLLILCSFLPMWKFPAITTPVESLARPDWQLIREGWRNRSIRCLWLHNWWLATFNGLTQAAFFLYSVSVLHVSLFWYYLMFNLMVLVKIPVSEWTGRFTDRHGHKRVLFHGVIVASSGVLFWLLATPRQWWWLFGAYLLWSAFAAVNISGQNLLLTLAPRSDNATHLGMFRLVAGLLAGVTGFLGGLWLTHLQQIEFHFTLGTYHGSGYQLLFLISLIGRWTSVLWLLPIKEEQFTPGQSEDRSIE